MRSPRWRCASGLTGVRFAIRAASGTRRSVLIVRRRRARRARRARSRGCCAAQSRFGAELDSLSRRDRVRRRAGADPLSLVAAASAAVRLDLSRCACGVLRAAARALQRANRRRPSSRTNRPASSPAFRRRRGRGWRCCRSICGCRPASRSSARLAVVAPWAAFIAFLMISSLADLSAGRRCGCAAMSGCEALVGDRAARRGADHRALARR